MSCVGAGDVTGGWFRLLTPGFFTILLLEKPAARLLDVTTRTGAGDSDCRRLAAGMGDCLVFIEDSDTLRGVFLVTEVSREGVFLVTDMSREGVFLVTDVSRDCLFVSRDCLLGVFVSDSDTRRVGWAACFAGAAEDSDTLRVTLLDLGARAVAGAGVLKTLSSEFCLIGFDVTGVDGVDICLWGVGLK